MANKDNRSSPKHFVIIQLTRAGDLIQTLQAVQELRNERPQAIVTLVARKHYAQTLRFLLDKAFNHIITIDTPTLFSQDLAFAQQTISNTISEIAKTPVDFAINLSYCKPSRYLTGLIPAAHRFGPWIGNDNQEVITDRWSQLLYSTVTQGSLNPFHLVDLFRLVIGTNKRKSHISKKANEERKNWIVVHPFASAERKRWKPHKWAEILYQLARDHEKSLIFVVGAPNEVADAKLIFEGPLLKSKNNVINIVGQTSLIDVYERLKVSKLFVGHDSLISHLASLAQTKAVTLALGSVRAWETAPYGEGNIVLSPRTKCFPCFPQDECSQYQCHSDIPYQLVTELAKIQILSADPKKALSEKITNFMTSSCHIHITRFQANSQLLELVELDQKPETNGEIMRTFYRMTWAFLIGEMDETLPFPMLARDSHAKLLQTMEGLGYLYELAEFGKKYSMQVVEEIAKPSPSLSKIKASTQKIDEIDRLSSLVKKSHPSLAPVVDFFGLMRANLPGGNIVELAQQSFFVYQDTSLAANVMSELMEKTIAEYKISQTKVTPIAR